MLEQVRNTFPGAEVQDYGDDTFLVIVAGRRKAFRHTPDGRQKEASEVHAPLEDLRDAWYKQLKDEARKNLDDLRAALRVPEAPPKAPVWGDLVFTQSGKAWEWIASLDGKPLNLRNVHNNLQVFRNKVDPPQWTACVGFRSGKGTTQQAAIESLLVSVRASYKHHAWEARNHATSRDARAAVLAMLGVNV